MKIQVRYIAAAATSAAVICALAPWTIPVGPVPITLATLGVYLASCVVDYRHGVAATVAYVAAGAAGLPVFSGGSGGFGVLAGPTGGYIIGYIFLALTAGIIIDIFGEKRVWVYPLAMVFGTAVLYLFGTGWYMLSSGADAASAVVVCVLPFLPGDCVKIAAAAAVGHAVRRALKKTVFSASRGKRASEKTKDSK